MQQHACTATYCSEFELENRRQLLCVGVEKGVSNVLLTSLMSGQPIRLTNPQDGPATAAAAAAADVCLSARKTRNWPGRLKYTHKAVSHDVVLKTDWHGYTPLLRSRAHTTLHTTLLQWRP
jgi:hypothetical protein